MTFISRLISPGGAAVQKALGRGESMVVEFGCVAAFSEACKIVAEERAGLIREPPYAQGFAVKITGETSFTRNQPKLFSLSCPAAVVGLARSTHPTSLCTVATYACLLVSLPVPCSSQGRSRFSTSGVGIDFFRVPSPLLGVKLCVCVRNTRFAGLNNLICYCWVLSPW